MKTDGIAETVRRFRPGLWPFLWAHLFAGFIATHGKNALRLDLESWLEGLLAGAHWAILLGGPAAALTAVFSQPFSGPSGPNVPKEAAASKTGWAAVALLLLGLGLSPLFSWRYFDACLIGVIVLAANAAPPIALSGFKIGSLAAQAFGYGALTFYAGFAASGVPEFRAGMSPLHLLGFVLLFCALRFAICSAPSKWEPWLYWFFLAGGFACLVGAEVRLGSRLATAPLGVPLIGWCMAGVRRDDVSGAHPPLSVESGLGLCLATDAALALSALLR